jgi:nucleoside 2-deoxyribosyltransferase
MKTIYFGCPLTHSTPEYRSKMVEIRAELEKTYNVLKFYSDPNQMNFDQDSNKICQEIYKWDKNCVESCDVFVAFADYPSTGLGMELAFATSKQKPILLLSQKEVFVPRMARGIVGTVFSHQQYENQLDVLKIIHEFINSL